MDYLDSLLKFTHITKDEIDRFHYWLRTNPIQSAEEDRKAKIKAEMFSILMCFTSRLNIPDAFDEENKVSVDELLAEINEGTGNDEKSTVFLFEMLVHSGIVLLTPVPEPGAGFETETTFVYIEPRHVKDYLSTKMRADAFDHPDQKAH